MLLRAFPDLHVAIEDLIAEGDKVVARNTVTGTHQGEYHGVPPTGKSVTYHEIFIFRFAGGQIAEIWGVVDVYSQLRQLGLIPRLKSHEGHPHPRTNRHQRACLRGRARCHARAQRRAGQGRRVRHHPQRAGLAYLDLPGRPPADLGHPRPRGVGGRRRAGVRDGRDSRRRRGVRADRPAPRRGGRRVRRRRGAQRGPEAADRRPRPRRGGAAGRPDGVAGPVRPRAAGRRADGDHPRRGRRGRVDGGPAGPLGRAPR